MNTYLTKHFSMKLQTQRGLFVRFFQSLKLSTLGMLTLLGVVALGLVACGGGGGSSGGGGGGDQMLLTPSGDNWNLVIATRISQATQPAAQSESGGQGGLRAQSAGGFTPTAITPGQTFTLEVDVYNDGEDASPEVTLTFYRSTDSTIDTADDIAGVIAIPSLEANGDTDDIVTHNLELPPPSDSTKDYVYGTCIINDETPSDNCAASEVASDGSITDDVTVAIQWDWSVPSVNVTWSVASHVLSDDVIQGWPITLRAEVANAATGFTAPRSAITFYRSTDATIDTSDTVIGHFTVPALSVGEDADGSITSTAPTTPGDYYFGACIPSDSSESNAGNNCAASAAVTVIDGGWWFWSRARLVEAYGDRVKTFTYKPGATFDLYALIGNEGDNYGKSASPAISLTYYRATDAAFSARSYKAIDPSVDTNIGTSDIPGLELNEDYRAFIQAIAPTDVGTYHYAMCVPHSGNLGARCSLEQFSSSGALGYVTVIVSPSGADGDTAGGTVAGFHLGAGTALNPGFTVHTMTIAANTQFTLHVSSCNWIRSAENSEETTVTVLRSSDTTILDDGSDTSIGTGAVPVLYPGQCVDHTLTPTTPSTPGVYRYGACVPETINSKTNQEGVTRCSPATYSDGDPGYVTVTVPGASGAACVSGQVYTAGQSCTYSHNSKAHTFTVKSGASDACVNEGADETCANHDYSSYTSFLWWPSDDSGQHDDYDLGISAYEVGSGYRINLGGACVSGATYSPWQFCTYTYNSRVHEFSVDPPPSFWAGVTANESWAGACVNTFDELPNEVDVCTEDSGYVANANGITITAESGGNYKIVLQ